MHARTWLSLFSFPLVAAFTYPVVVKAPPVTRSEPKTVSQDPLAGLTDIQDVLDLVRANYVETPEMDKVIGGGIQAALERVHPLNSMLTQDDLRLPDPGPADLGITLLKRTIYAQVISVAPSGPAAKAGFHVGDVIRKVNGESINSMSPWALERSLRGAEGSEVTLTRNVFATGEMKQITLQRAKPAQTPAILRKGDKVAILVVQDLGQGRAVEIRKLLDGLDRSWTLILDFRECASGSLLEAAAMAGLFTGDGTLATVQESGKDDVPVFIKSANLAPFRRLALLQGPWTIGPAEALASAFKHAGIPTFGDRTYGLGVERVRFHLRQGGAVELVSRRWIGAGGEKLGGSVGPGADRPGVVAKYVLRGLKPDEDPVPRVLETLEASTPKIDPAPSAKTSSRSAMDLRRDIIGIA